jgi:hypothetical protein
MATDTGDVVLTGTATVFINLTDVNDCPPRFIMENFTAVVQVRQASCSSLSFQCSCPLCKY